MVVLGGSTKCSPLEPLRSWGLKKVFFFRVSFWGFAEFRLWVGVLPRGDGGISETPPLENCDGPLGAVGRKRCRRCGRSIVAAIVEEGGEVGHKQGSQPHQACRVGLVQSSTAERSGGR